MKQKQKKLLLGGLIFLFLGGVGWVGFFKYTLYRIEANLALAETTLKQKGFEVGYSALKVCGTPFSFNIIIQAPHLKSPKGEIAWKGQVLNLSMPLWCWRKATYNLFGEHHITVGLEAIPLKGVYFKEAHGQIAWTSQQALDQWSFLADQVKFFKGTRLQPIFLEGVTLTLKEMAHPLAMQVYLTTILRGVDTFFQEPASSKPIT